MILHHSSSYLYPKLLQINALKCSNLKKQILQYSLSIQSPLILLPYKVKNIIVTMDRKDYTPTKQSKILGGHTPMVGRESMRGGEPSILRQYEVLRAQARQLEMQNRQLAGEVDKLKYEKSMQENKMLQKASFEEEAIAQLQKEKNYQIEMLRIKNQEDINRARREHDLKLDDILREIRNRETVNKELQEKNSYVQGKVGELRGLLSQLQGELVRLREGNSVLSEQLTKQQFANKKLEMLQQQLQRQKNEMQSQIHILLDIEAEKSRTISTLELQLQSSQESEQELHQKLALLTDNFLALDEHIALIKDRLTNADLRGEELDQQLNRVEYVIAEKEQLILEQRDREVRLRQQIDAHKQREARRMQQVQHLMLQNQRAYGQLVGIRHRLYDVSIEQGIDL